MYRVFPEPWQVVAQVMARGEDGEVEEVKDVVVWSGEEKPKFVDAIRFIREAGAVGVA